MDTKRLAVVAAAALAGVLAALLALRLGGSPHEFVGTVYSNPDAAPGFELTADTGQRASLSDFEDKVVLLYFGYTFCPDICPASLAELATALDTLNAGDRDQVQVMMISVDPARDTPQALAEYMDYFDPSFVGLTGTDQEIAAVAADYNVFYEVEEGSAATGYLVNHWAGVYVIDRDGLLVESFGFGTPGEEIAADVEEWL